MPQKTQRGRQSETPTEVETRGSRVRVSFRGARSKSEENRRRQDRAVRTEVGAASRKCCEDRENTRCERSGTCTESQAILAHHAIFQFYQRDNSEKLR